MGGEKRGLTPPSPKEKSIGAQYELIKVLSILKSEKLPLMELWHDTYQGKVSKLCSPMDSKKTKNKKSYALQ